jgi:hypothetical protein
MERGYEQLIFFAVILLAALVDWVVRWLKSKGQSPLPPDAMEPADQEDDDPWAEQYDLEPEVVQPAPLPPAEPARRPAAAAPRPQWSDVVRTELPRVAAPAAQRIAYPAPPAVRFGATDRPRLPRPTPRSARWVRDPAAARRGIVMMEILGPCRGLEPPRGEA